MPRQEWHTREIPLVDSKQDEQYDTDDQHCDKTGATPAFGELIVYVEW